MWGNETQTMWISREMGAFVYEEGKKWIGAILWRWNSMQLGENCDVCGEGDEECDS